MRQYDITDHVPKTGEYVCAACGEISEFEEGDDFSPCDYCGDEEGAGWTLAFLEEEEGLSDVEENMEKEFDGEDIV